MNKTKITLWLLSLSGAAFVSCSAPDNHDVSDLAFKRVEVAKAFKLVNSAEAYGSDSDLVIACRADLLLPTAVFGGNADALSDSILDRTFGVKDASKENENAVIEEYFREYASTEGYDVTEMDVPDAYSDAFFGDYDGYSSIEVRPITVSPELLSFQLLAGMYAPRAAHGMYSTMYINYDVLQGRVVELSDLVTPEGIDALPAILKKRVKAMARIIGPTELDGLPAGDNFYINASNDFVFAYQPYEIASYAQGEIKIPVPAYELGDYLTPAAKTLLLR